MSKRIKFVVPASKEDEGIQMEARAVVRQTGYVAFQLRRVDSKGVTQHGGDGVDGDGWVSIAAVGDDGIVCASDIRIPQDFGIKTLQGQAFVEIKAYVVAVSEADDARRQNGTVFAQPRKCSPSDLKKFLGMLTILGVQCTAQHERGEAEEATVVTLLHTELDKLSTGTRFRFSERDGKFLGSEVMKGIPNATRKPKPVLSHVKQFEKLLDDFGLPYDRWGDSKAEEIGLSNGAVVFRFHPTVGDFLGLKHK